MTTGNVRHQVAEDRRAEKIRELRAEIHVSLAKLLKLAGHLDDLADTRQSVGLGFQTPEIQEARGRHRQEHSALDRGRVPHPMYCFQNDESRDHEEERAIDQRRQDFQPQVAVGLIVGWGTARHAGGEAE